MKRKVSKLRLSPNEEARIIREELERRRKLRIQQVREQQREIALQIRQEVEQRRQHELRQLEEQLREDWERQQKEKLQTLQSFYQESLQLLGQSHRNAKENEPDPAAAAQREEENHAKAEERYREALKELKIQRIKEQEKQKQSINVRKKVLQKEKERSAKVASLPPPIPHPIQDIDPKKPHVVKRSDLNAFAATHYHMPESTVEKELDTVQPDAREEAEVEARRLQDLQGEEQRRREEQLEKARLRGRQALRREQLIQDREHLLVELEHMQQTDLLRRRQQVSQMPPQIFQPLFKRQETREEFQREMEFAFEDLCTGERRVKGDLVVQLVPEPLPASSSTSQDLDQELDVTLDENTKPEAENIQKDFEDGVGSSEQERLAEEALKPPPRRALRKLLDRIRSQRNDWINGSTRIPAEDSPTDFTDLIPERDTSIETGSLTSEMDKRTLIRIGEPTILPPTVEPSELQPAAESPLPGVFLSRIQEAEERMKREAELELQKRQQNVLLQDLEEQKAKLEQMLQEAQQEREQLKAAVSQEAPLLQSHIPVQDQVRTGLTCEALCPAGEDEATRRLREYQRRLLEQNRIHRRSVEVARLRLEEYQRALWIRHNMTTTLLRPPVHPAGLVPPCLSDPGSEHPPQAAATPPVPSDAQPKTSVDFAMRDLSASPPPPASSSSSGSCFLLEESVGSRFSTRRPDVTAQLTDGILQRATQHSPERLRPSRVTAEPFKFPTGHGSSSTSSPSDPSQPAGPKIIPDIVPLDPGLRAVSLISREEDLEWRRRELQEAQRRVIEQREAVALQEKLQEEDRRRAEVELEQMRRQKETLQALMGTDEQSDPDAPSEGLESEDIRQKRLTLLASLLRAIEESNGGTLSHLEDPEEADDFPEQTQSDRGVGEAPLVLSVIPAEPPEPCRFFHPPRTQRPPVTQVRLGFKEMMPEQHELSAIQEVETPVNLSRVTGPEDNFPSHPVDFHLQDGSGSFATSDRTVQSQSVSSCGPDSAERRVDSETCSHLPWRERLLSGAGTSPECSDSDSVMEVVSPLCSDSGRGADSIGPAVLSCKSPSELLPRPAESTSLSSTSISISSGSYISTEPEQHGNTGDGPRPVKQNGSGLGEVSSPCAQALRMKESSASSSAGPSVDSVFNDSSIQRIIDKYTRELNVSLSAAGTAADGEGPSLEESSSSGSQQPLVGLSGMRMEDSAGLQGVVLHAAAQSHIPEILASGLPTLERFSPGALSLNVDLEQDSFRPLHFQLTDQSSCLAPEESQSVLEQLVGQPSANSSTIGPRPGPPASPSSDLSRWDSTLTRMIGSLSQRSGSRRLSPGQDFDAGRITSEPSWLEEFPEEIRMRPLVGELDDSAEQHSGSSGAFCSGVTETRLLCSGARSPAAPGVSTESSEPSRLASAHSPSVPHVSPQSQVPQNQPGLVKLDSYRAEDSFHPLLLEITHNETADPSMTFHLPEHNTSDSSDRNQADAQHGVSTPSVEDDPSPEQLRTEEPNCCRVLEESFSQLVISEESVLILSPTMRTGSCVPSNSGTPVLSTSQAGTSKELKHLVPVGELHGQHENQQDFSASETSEAVRERGILDQSQITLVSLTDTTLQDEDMITTDDEEVLDNRGPDSIKEDGQEGVQTKGAGSTSGEDPDCWRLQASSLVFQWSPIRDLQDVFQQKRQALIQRSNRRVEELKAKRSVGNNEPGSRVLAEGIDLVEADRVQSVTWKIKTTSKLQSRTHDEEKGDAQKKLHQPSQVSGSSPTGSDEVRISSPEQRKRNHSEMHRRTRRLYEQLEEVKQQRAVRSRQEDGAKNRLKAKEFHRVKPTGKRYRSFVPGRRDRDLEPSF
ncbi:uncharacterized protein cep295 isoform X2 [Girardinichthys multiradiatus]|uniref:uncharacterized protein cep295 isoform X2 n=1 Tax=Girardinichthys multiradiatus TaxID=208333 RepID=UPI001FAB8A34|nr:uncharacterized protein cep295 isoform X2 [Girardinichthys multiradiatus]